MFEKAVAEFKRLDIVMSNSGIEHFGELAQITPEDIDRVLGVNVKAQFLVSQQAIKYLGDNGRLVLISSVSAVMVGCFLLLLFFLLLHPELNTDGS